MGLRRYISRSHRRGTPCYGLQPRARLLSRPPRLQLHDFIASMVVGNAQTAIGRLGGVSPVGTCHASWINSSRFSSIMFDSMCVHQTKYLGIFFFISIGSTFPRPKLQLPSFLVNRAVPIRRNSIRYNKTKTKTKTI